VAPVAPVTRIVPGIIYCLLLKGRWTEMSLDIYNYFGYCEVSMANRWLLARRLHQGQVPNEKI
jgi:hypothetical protein